MINKYSVKTYCKDFTKIENYEKAINDTTQMWECHHRNESYYTRKELISLGLYYDCPPCELIFLTVEEHGKQCHKGRQKTLEARQNISKANKGKKLSEECKEKISKSMKGHKLSEETKQKISKAKKGIKFSDERKREISKRQLGKKRGPYKKRG